MVGGAQIRQEKSRYRRVMRALIRAVTLHDISRSEALLPQWPRRSPLPDGVSKSLSGATMVRFVAMATALTLRHFVVWPPAKGEGKALSSAGHALRISLRPYTPLHNPPRSPQGAHQVTSRRRGRYSAFGSQYTTSLLSYTPWPQAWSVCSCATMRFTLFTPLCSR